MEKTHPNLMRVADLAKYLGRTEGAVRMMIRRGLLPYRRHGGRIIASKNKIDKKTKINVSIYVGSWKSDTLI